MAGVCVADAIPLTVGIPFADNIPALGEKAYTFSAATDTAHHLFVTPTAEGRAGTNVFNSAGQLITGVPIGDARAFLLFAPATPFARDIYVRVRQNESDDTSEFVGQTDFLLEVQTTGDGTTPATAIDGQQIEHSEPAFPEILPLIRIGALSENETRFYKFDAEETRGYFISVHSFAPAPVDWILFTDPADPAGSVETTCTSEFVNEFALFAADCDTGLLTKDVTYYLGLEQKGAMPSGRTTTNYDIHRF